MSNFAFFAHMFGLVMLAAGVGVANYSGIMIGRSATASSVALWSQVNHRIEYMATLPGALILLLSGTYMVDDRGFGFGDVWVGAAYALWLLAVVVGAGVLGANARGLHRAATAAVAAGHEDDADVLARSNSPIGPVLGNVLNVIVVAFLYLMVYKPGA
ncbi:MAG: hypothetical protein JWN72_2869 [Thermoleophilia bacterium]|nr:hypothetical protein [Thermoleophilia bacterium]